MDICYYWKCCYSLCLDDVTVWSPRGLFYSLCSLVQEVETLVMHW